MNATKKNLSKTLLLFILFAGKAPLLFSDTNKTGFFNLNFLELYESARFSTPKTAYQKDDLSLSTFSLVYGARLSLKALDLRFYQGHSAVKFSQMQLWNSIDDYCATQKNPVWSVELNAGEFSQSKVQKIPLKLMAGSLNYSQCISRLKSPSFYKSTSPFCMPCNFNDGLGIYTAQKTASEKPVSFAASYKDKKLCFQGAVFTDSNFYFSASCKSQPLDFFKLYTLFCITKFSLEMKKQDGWKLSSRFFTEQSDFAFYAESLISVPFFKTKISAGIFENPFNSVRSFLTAESVFHLSFFSLGAAVFLSDSVFTAQKEPFFTISGNEEKTLFQFKINPQFEFITKEGLSFKTGVSFFYDSSIDSAGYFQTEKETLDVIPGILISGRKNKILIQYKMQDILTEESSHEISARYSSDFKKLSLAVSTKFQFQPFYEDFFQNNTAGISLYLYPKNFPVYSILCSGLFEKKSETLNSTINFGISTSFSVKKTKINAKIQINHTLPVE
ncbi:MAG: hypothetical protein ACI4LX_03720 [Treponema sp.]